MIGQFFCTNHQQINVEASEKEDEGNQGDHDDNVEHIISDSDSETINDD
jgi:hypothetical protein